MTQNYLYMHLPICHLCCYHDLTQGREGVTQGMSLKGRQTGNTSGCCQNVFLCLVCMSTVTANLIQGYIQV